MHARTYVCIPLHGLADQTEGRRLSRAEGFDEPPTPLRFSHDYGRAVHDFTFHQTNTPPYTRGAVRGRNALGYDAPDGLCATHRLTAFRCWSSTNPNVPGSWLLPFPFPYPFLFPFPFPLPLPLPFPFPFPFPLPFPVDLPRYTPDRSRVPADARVYTVQRRVSIARSLAHSLMLRAFSRSLHRCGSCTKVVSVQQALPGRVSLSLAMFRSSNPP